MAAYRCLHQSLAMFSLAIVSNWSRERLFRKDKNGEESTSLNLPSEFRAERLPKDIADRLRERVASGDVTCIVAKPEPFTWILVRCDMSWMRTIYGIWVGRPASWRGSINPSNLPRLDNTLTVEEAIARGVPIPEMKS